MYEPPFEVTGLTDQQEELLRAALREGYFSVPRHTTLVTLAEQQGISDKEASRELRTGVATVLSEMVDDDSQR